MTTSDFAARLMKACTAVRNIEEELNTIDARFGDADHGLTMTKIARALEAAAEGASGQTFQALIGDCAAAIGNLGGGSAIPLWGSLLDGMAETAPESDTIDIDGLKAMFASGFEMLDFMSGAQVGDKTMMDAAIPAAEAIAAYDGTDIPGLFQAAAEAAMRGAENTKNFPSKFGRAKYYGDKTIGTCDAGALSMATFFQGLAE